VLGLVQALYASVKELCSSVAGRAPSACWWRAGCAAAAPRCHWCCSDGRAAAVLPPSTICGRN